MKFLVALLFILFGELINGQICFFQDTWRGTVKCTEFSVGATAAGYETVDLSIPLGSSLKKVFLMTYSLFDPDSTLIKINGSHLEWNQFSVVSEVFLPIAQSVYKIQFADVTNVLSTSFLSNSNVEIKNTCGLTKSSCGLFGAHFFVLSENINDSITTFSLQIPDKTILGDETYEIINLNPIDTLYSTGFSVYLDRSTETIQDGSYIRIDDNLLGYIYGGDIQNLNYVLSGTQGNFEYRNRTITGLNEYAH